MTIKLAKKFIQNLKFNKPSLSVFAFSGSGKLSMTSDGLMPRDCALESCSTVGECSLVGDERGDENIA